MKQVKPLYSVLLSGLALVSCGNPPEDPEPVVITDVPASSAPPAVVPAEASLSVDPSLAPGNDFYAYAVGHWTTQTPIPEGMTNYGPLTQIREKAAHDILYIVDGPTDPSLPPTTAMLRAVFEAYTNEEKIDARGLTPLKRHLAIYEAAATNSELLTSMARPDLGVILPIAMTVKPDLASTHSYAVHIEQGALGLQWAEIYSAPEYGRARGAYVEFLTRCFEALGTDKPDERAKAVLQLEMHLAQGHWAPKRLSSPEHTYNLLAPEELALLAPGLPWENILEENGYSTVPTLIVENPDLLKIIAELSKDLPLETWKDYAKIRLILLFLDVLPSDLRAEYAAIEQMLSSREIVALSRQDDAVREIDTYLRPELAYSYILTFGREEDKDELNSMVAALLTGFKKRLSSASWLALRTRKISLQKIEAMRLKIAYPDDPIPPRHIEVWPNDAFTNHLNLLMAHHENDAAKLFTGNSIESWPTPPYQPLMRYVPNRNEIVVPMALIQPPLYAQNASLAKKYGGIGAVIGHELWHSVDDIGRLADARGFAENWWLPSDLKAYLRLTQPLRQQLEASPYNADLILNEMIGDIAGLSIALDALDAELDAQSISPKDRKAAHQAFFIHWAQSMRRVYSEAELKRRMVIDPHAPAAERVNRAVRNIDAWYDAFDVSKEHELYLPEETRLQLW